MIKWIGYLLVGLFTMSAPATYAQNEGMFKQKKERKKLWRRWNRKRDAYNPYLSKKAKDKPSAQIAKSNNREQKRQKRQFKRQLRRAKKNH
jgi:hypothetical protein